MTMTGRDKKVLMVIVPLMFAAVYWFLLLAPKREEASKAGDELAKQEQRRDAARGKAAAAESSRKNFGSDYSQLVNLGKAVPTQLDMPTVIVQLESAARGTGIQFSRIATGTRNPAAGGAPAQQPAAPGGDSSTPASAGGKTAQSAPGGAVEAAGNNVNDANSASAARERSGVDPSDAQKSTSAGASDARGGAGAGSGAATLDSVPLTLEFRGSFFRLADFFHRLKRFVHVANDRVAVRGRLLTVEGVSFKSAPESFPVLTVELEASVYLTPQAQGATAGATPQGPAPPAPTAAPIPTAAATP